jgi:hypothetical protein
MFSQEIGAKKVLYTYYPKRPFGNWNPRRRLDSVNPTTKEIENMSTRLASRFLLAVAFSATLAPAVFADNAAVLGTWNITIEDGGFDEEDLDITLEIEESADGSLTGTWNSERGDDDLEDVEWDGKELSFVRIVEVFDEDLEVEHTAEITGDTLEGEMDMPLRDVEFSGERED